MTTLTRPEIQKMLAFVRSLDIATNPEPAALFDPLIQGFNVWCIPSDHPGGEWELIVPHMDKGAYSKRCEYVGCAFYYHQEGLMKISTDAYAFHDKFHWGQKEIHNRPQDLRWLEEKVDWVFQQIRLPFPTMVVDDDD